jgi:hypothetical protein
MAQIKSSPATLKVVGTITRYGTGEVVPFQQTFVVSQEDTDKAKGLVEKYERSSEGNQQSD